MKLDKILIKIQRKLLNYHLRKNYCNIGRNIFAREKDKIVMKLRQTNSPDLMKEDLLMQDFGYILDLSQTYYSSYKVHSILLPHNNTQ